MLTGRNWVKVFLVLLILNRIPIHYSVKPMILMDTNSLLVHIACLFVCFLRNVNLKIHLLKVNK